MTGLLDRLEAERFVTRRRHPDDGRRVMVFATKRALRAYDELRHVLEDIVDRFDCDPGASSVVSAFLEHVSAGLGLAASD